MNSKLTIAQCLIAGLTAGVVSAVINAVLFYVFHATGILADTVFVQPGQPLSIAPVIMASIVPSLVGSLVFFLIEKFTSKGFTIFRILAVTLAVLSLFSPFTVPQHGTTGYALVLCVMHLVVAFVLLHFIGQRVGQKAIA